ncbi:MAG: ribonuclease HIII [Cyanobacteria bacterium SIG30]|nr:ribonuclease HIII [Cyanobacteria bacterium SIG30]
MNTYTKKYNIADIDILKRIFEEENCTFSKPQYMFFQARKQGLTASFYTSGKMVLQGSKVDEILAKYFEVEIEEKQEILDYPHIGVDESGKGDFFGPLVIAGVYLDKKNAEDLQKQGVMDSKKLSDKQILILESKIKEVAKYNVILINPAKYNELYVSFKNLNKLLAWGHASVIENILKETECKLALCDQFADEKVILNALKEKGRQIKVIQKTKAEEDTAVACASILARAEFVKRMEKLSKDYEINLPKGASGLVKKTAQNFIQKYSKEELRHVSKTHFKTYQEI